MATHQDGHTLERNHELRFPPFHEGVLNERSWSAAEGLGRIRVELSAGFWEDSREVFVKINTVVAFAFQHCPLSKSSVPVFLLPQTTDMKQRFSSSPVSPGPVPRCFNMRFRVNGRPNLRPLTVMSATIRLTCRTERCQV